MKRFFHQDLDSLRSDLILMGQLAVEAVECASTALLENDPDQALKVYGIEDQIDELEIKIDAEVIKYFSLRGPVATDVRILTTAMKVCHALERIGDESKSIAKRVKRIHQEGKVSTYANLPKMKTLASNLLQNALRSLIEEDISLAESLPIKDKEIDILNKENYNLYTDLITNNPDQGRSAIELLFISKSMERVGDHAVNIASEVVFLLSAEDIRHTPQTIRAEDD